MGEYIPGAPINDEAKKRNGNLPGQGGVYNYVKLHVYHYAGNNPVKYVDPTGRDHEIELQGQDVQFDDAHTKEAIQNLIDTVKDIVTDPTVGAVVGVAGDVLDSTPIKKVSNVLTGIST